MTYLSSKDGPNWVGAPGRSTSNSPTRVAGWTRIHQSLNKVIVSMRMSMVKGDEDPTLRVARHSRKEEKKGCDEISTTEVSDWFLRRLRSRQNYPNWGGFVRVKIIQIEENRGDPRERRINEVLSWPLSSDWVLTNTSTIITVLTITLRSRQDGEMLNTVSGGARCIREAFNKCLSWGFIQDWDGVSTTGIHWAKVKSLDWRFSKIFWLSFQRDTVEVSFLCQIVKMIKTKYLDCWRPDSLRFLCPDNDYQLERVKIIHLNNDQTMTNWREWKLQKKLGKFLTEIKMLKNQEGAKPWYWMSIDTFFVIDNCTPSDVETYLTLNPCLL